MPRDKYSLWKETSEGMEMVFKTCLPVFWWWWRAACWTNSQLLFKTQFWSHAEWETCMSYFFCSFMAVLLSSIAFVFLVSTLGNVHEKTVLVTTSSTLNTWWANIMGSVQDFSIGIKVSNTCQGIKTSRCRKKLTGKDCLNARCVKQTEHTHTHIYINYWWIY